MEVSMRNKWNNSPRSPRSLRFLIAGLAISLLAACNGDSGGGSAGGDLSGTYQATGTGGSMTLEFKSGGKVTVTMQETGGQPDVAEADYMIEGDRVTIQIPGGFPFVVVRSGNTLEGGPMGEILHFRKK
jgi:hypothetical protein